MIQWEILQRPLLCLTLFTKGVVMSQHSGQTLNRVQLQPQAICCKTLSKMIFSGHCSQVFAYPRFVSTGITPSS